MGLDSILTRENKRSTIAKVTLKTKMGDLHYLILRLTLKEQ